MSSLISPIFIVGVPRSGTTLMASLLSAHPDIAISPESHFFNYWLPTWGTVDLKAFWQQLHQSQRFSYFGIDAEAVWSRAQAQAKLTHQTLFQAMLETYAAQFNKPRWGEKTPMHYLYLDQIFAWYPNAAVIWLLRDPRAVVASLLQVDWASIYTDENAYLWNQSLCHYRRYWQADPRVKQVRYETLLMQPQQCLQEICAFLNEPYRCDLSERRSLANSPIVNRHGWAVTHLRQALGTLEMAPLEKWKHQLSRGQVEIIEQINREVMVNYSYQPITSGETVFGKFRWQQEKTKRKLKRQIRQCQKRLGINQVSLSDRIHGLSSKIPV